MLTKRKVLIMTFLPESAIMEETMSGALFYLWLKLFLFIQIGIISTTNVY